MEAKSLSLVQDKSIELHTWDDIVERAKFLASSPLLPEAIRGNVPSVAIIIQMGHELGIGPMQAVNGINVIKGKPSVSPELAIALIRARAPDAYIKFNEASESKVSVTMARSKNDLDQSFTSVWTLQRAAQMGLANNHNYKSQPATMLKWRAVGEAARTVFPDVMKGVYVDEELNHMPNKLGGNKAEKIAQALQPKEVVSEVVVEEKKLVSETSNPGEELSGFARPQDNFLGDYVVPELKTPFDGMKLKDINEEALIEYMDKWDARLEAKQKENPEYVLTGKALEFKTRADQYLES
jgi:hypothetical protein